MNLATFAKNFDFCVCWKKSRQWQRRPGKLSRNFQSHKFHKFSSSKSSPVSSLHERIKHFRSPRKLKKNFCFGFKKSKQHSVKLRRSSNGDLFAEKRREASQLLPTKSSHVSTESSLSFVKTTLSLRLAFEEEREKVEEIILYNSVVVKFVCAEFECVSVKSKKKFSSK